MPPSIKHAAPLLRTTLAFLLLLPQNTLAQKQASKRDRVIALNNGIIEDVNAMLSGAAPELDIFNIGNGDTIADIGVGWGWLEGLLFMKHDSLTIYANDIHRQSLRNLVLPMM